MSPRFLDEVQKRHPAVAVLLRDGDHEPQVRLDEPVLAPLAPTRDALGEAYLVGVREQAYPSYLRQVHPDGVAGRDRVRYLHRGGIDNPVAGTVQRGLGLRPGRGVGLDEGDGLLLERGVELFDLGGREVTLLQQIGDLLRTYEPLAQKLVGPLRQHRGVLGRHQSPFLSLGHSMSLRQALRLCPPRPGLPRSVKTSLKMTRVG
jgi:hypothetical protein